MLRAQVVGFLASALLALLLCGLHRHLSLRHGWVSARSVNRSGPGGVPVRGGLALLPALAAGVGLTIWLVGPLAGAGAVVAAVCTLVLMLALVGASDDIFGLSPQARLALETLAALTVLAVLGIGPGGPEPGTVSGGVVVAALVTVAGANAFNMVDNADALAATTGSVTFLALSGLALLGAGTVSGGAILAPAAAGVLVGFLYWNRPPARLYLGDVGSLPLGGLLAALLLGAAREAGTAYLPAIGLLAGCTLFDPLYAVVGRLAEGRAPWRGGVDHLSHDLGRALGGWPAALRLIVCVHLYSVATGLLVLRGLLPLPMTTVALVLWAALGWLAARGRTRPRRPV